MKPITILLSVEHFQRNRNNANSLAEELANAIRMHDGFRGRSIVFEIRPSFTLSDVPIDPKGVMPGVIYVRT